MKPIIAVTGLGRSGTSLMMRMLNEGGVTAYADENVTFEFANCQRPEAIIDHCPGKCVKLMDPVRWKPPRGYKYLFIWMQRDFKQQAKSHAKIQRELHHLHPTREHIRRYQRQFKAETIQAKKLLQSYENSRLITVNFEDLLKKPLEESRRILYFLQPHFQPSPSLMARQVVNRKPDCLDGLLEKKYM